MKQQPAQNDSTNSANTANSIDPVNPATSSSSQQQSGQPQANSAPTPPASITKPNENPNQTTPQTSTPANSNPVTNQTNPANQSNNQTSGNEDQPESEALSDQNIFLLLGVTDGSNQEREEFLDELQQVIWEDFLEYDAKLLLTSEDYQKLQEQLSSKEDKSLEQQEAAIVFLEDLVPELEEIMLEKALELKADLLRERIAGMKEYFAGQPEAEQKIKRAEDLILQERWRSAAELLNSIG